MLDMTAPRKGRLINVLNEFAELVEELKTGRRFVVNCEFDVTMDRIESAILELRDIAQGNRGY